MKKKYLFLSLGGCLMALFSCDNNESDYQDLFPEEYHKILYIKDSGSVELELSQLSSTLHIIIHLLFVRREAILLWRRMLILK